MTEKEISRGAFLKGLVTGIAATAIGGVGFLRFILEKDLNQASPTPKPSEPVGTPKPETLTLNIAKSPEEATETPQPELKEATPKEPPFTYFQLQKGESVDVGEKDFALMDGSVNGKPMYDNIAKTALIIDFETSAELTADYPGDVRTVSDLSKKPKLVLDAVLEKLTEEDENGQKIFKQVVVKTYKGEGQIETTAYELNQKAN